MANLTKSIIVLLSVFLWISCDARSGITSPDLKNNPYPICGNWVFNSYAADFQSIMIRSDSLASDRYGFIINQDGTFIERKLNNSGTYTNYSGTWEPSSGCSIKISVNYGTGAYPVEKTIISITSSELIFCNGLLI